VRRRRAGLEKYALTVDDSIEGCELVLRAHDEVGYGPRPMRSALLVTPLLAFVFASCLAEPDPEPIAAAEAPIIGGIDDTFRSYVVGVGDSQGAFCTGTLVSKRTVLTAGHCYTPGQGAQGGITRIFFGADVSAGQSWVGTVQAVRHPMYNDNTLSHDITMVELDSDAPSQAVPLLRETMSNTADFVGPYFSFVGYGNDGSFNYGVRKVAVFPIERVGPASDVGLDTQSGPIDATQFYFRVADKNTCDGDSGGPAFLPRQHVERLAGSTSYGDGPCMVDGVDARTDLPEIMAFIQPTIDLFEGTDPCRGDGMCDETCNKGGQLGDPDCAENHCGADGICALSCVNPPDPDCAAVPHCDLDGVCDPTCAPTDLDCLPPPDGGAPTTSSNGAGGGRTTSSTTSTTSSTTSTTSAGAGGADAGADGGPDGRASDSGGCGCTTAGDARSAGSLGLLAIGAIVSLRRRRSTKGR
jgi:MYXO-CTERM domain-containing protein